MNKGNLKQMLLIHAFNEEMPGRLEELRKEMGALDQGAAIHGVLNGGIEKYPKELDFYNLASPVVDKVVGNESLTEEEKVIEVKYDFYNKKDELNEGASEVQKEYRTEEVKPTEE